MPKVSVLAYGGTASFSQPSEPHYYHYILFISASYLIVLGLNKLKVLKIL